MRVVVVFALVCLCACDKRQKNEKMLRTMASSTAGLIQSGFSCEKVVETEGGDARGGDDLYGTPTRLDCAKRELCSAGPDKKHHTADDQCVPLTP